MLHRWKAGIAAASFSASLLALCSMADAQTAALPAAAAVASAAAGLTEVRSVEGITEYSLPNGLQVLLIPDDSKPTTTVNVTYRVGSRYENYGETGMAHLLEHLMFKGSPNHPAVWSEFTKRGLQANGTTWFDRTNYFASFAANEDNLKWYLTWQADAMVNSYIARKDLDTEMTVVRNEMEMGENDPGRILFEKTLSTMFQWHNYGKDTIGARTDVENVDIPRLQAFYREYYQPDNATLIVSGKFKPDTVRAWVADAFGKIPRPTRKIPVQYTLDPVQDGERSVTLRRVGGVPILYAAYHVPAGSHPDFASIEMLDLIFGDTPSGRLHKKLTETQLASSTFGFSEALAEPGFVLMGAQLSPGQEVDKARSVMLESIESVAREPITEEEFKRAQAKWLKSWDLAFTNPERVGVSLSESVAQGDWRLFFLTRDRVKNLKLADLQRVAETYLVQSNRTLGTYLPTEKPLRAAALAKVDVAAALKDFKGEAAAAATEAFEATPANIEARTEKFAVGGVQAALLPKGTRGGVVRASLTLRFGDEKSLFGQSEVAEMVGSLLDKGTKTMTRQQIQDHLDALQTEMRIRGTAGRVSVSLSSRRDQLPAAIALVGDLLRNATFPPEALDELKRQSLAGLEQQRKEPDALVENAIDRLGSPYPRGDVRYTETFEESEQEIAAVTIEKVRAFHQQFYGASKGEFAATGDMDVAAVKAALQSAFGEWKGSMPFTRVPQPLVAISPERFILKTPDKQNAMMLVRLAVPLSDNDADYPALMMANYLLGSGGNSRFWKRIRETEGLSYDVRSNISWNSHEPNSSWQASAIYAPQNRPKVEAAFREEIARAQKDGFTQQELDEGRRGLLSFRGLSRAQDATVAAALANNLYLGRTFMVSAKVDEALSGLTLDQVDAALRKYLKPDQFVMGFGGDFKE